MISRLATAATLVLLVGTVAVPVSPASTQPISDSAPVAIEQPDTAQIDQSDSEAVPESTLAELDVVLPAVTAGVVEESPELEAGRDDEDVVVVDEVVADRVASEIVETETFQTLGVTWLAGTDIGELEPQVRVRTDGEWSEWLEMEEDSGGPDPGTADALNAVKDGTDTLWVGDSDAVQVSFLATEDAGPEDLALVLIGSEEVPLASDDAIVGSSDTDAEITTASYLQGPLAMETGAPQVISRSDWGARAQVCTPDVATQLVGAVVHHTAGSNDYATVAEAMQQIRNDQRYHIESRGWCDIGYNFIVDKWGNIYEGRANSLTQPVIGVHAGGFNTGTVGVSMLGTYGGAPSAATQQSVAHIIGWRLGYYGVNPEGTMSYWTNVGENSKYQNTWVTLPRVFSHRDVAYTACPGDGGFNALPAIRTMADNFSFGERFRVGRALATAFYWDLLDREPDVEGLEYWSGQLAQGASPKTVAGRIGGGREYAGLRIQEAYRNVLGREADSSGLLVWVNRVQAGTVILEDIPLEFMTRSEFYTAAGSDAGFVAALYEKSLGRSADPSEIEVWVDRIPVLGRAEVASRIWGSAESAARRVTTYYETLLGREPDPGGLAKWSDVLRSRGEAYVRSSIAGSLEYWNLAVTAFG